jgi:ornithine cyclodeaminase/alanine dehydrogenase-like protein (mu-crystallin family)
MVASLTPGTRGDTDLIGQNLPEVWVDDVVACRAEAGDLHQGSRMVPGRYLWQPCHPFRKGGRPRQTLAVFKSVGLSCEGLAVAIAAYRRLSEVGNPRLNREML